ncbi:LysR substrate-binding domain-containing protein [Salinicola peritrichatus]|uniref:LysR substrate-binding domain-containing protein n=1 Tax=Salinicola peritrichatus TaxID=1267424 RepID=UPI000DA12F81|nr:LysR substrate-binding domain-containing protein [Salinicola peritrichatus]
MRRFLPSLSALQAFEAAARHLSFTRAAKELFVTQSGVSRQIANLEQHLGLRLFERSGSRIVLTDAGNAYFHEIEPLLNELEETSIDLVRGRKRDAALMIGATVACASRWLAPRLADFIQRAPDFPIEIHSVGDDIDFSTSQIDIAIMRGAGVWSGARARKLFVETLAVVASPRLIPREEQLDRLDFSRIPTLQNASRPSLWLEWLRASGLNHRGTIQGIRFADSDMLIGAAVSGLGLAVLPAHYVERELQNGELHLPFGDPVRSPHAYWVVSPERKSHQQRSLLFQDWLIQAADTLPR